jgi:hypothetical protein
MLACLLKIFEVFFDLSSPLVGWLAASNRIIFSMIPLSFSQDEKNVFSLKSRCSLSHFKRDPHLGTLVSTSSIQNQSSARKWGSKTNPDQPAKTPAPPQPLPVPGRGNEIPIGDLPTSA